MQKRQSILLAIGIVIVVVGLRYLTFLNVHHRLNERHHLLCEVLKPGMSENEVLIVLKQVGDFTMNRGEWGGGYIALDINFTDAKARNQYDSFSVVFLDYKYARAVVPHASDKPEVICDFYQAPQTETLKP